MNKHKQSMALRSSLSVLSANSIPKFTSSYFNPRSVSVPTPLKLQQVLSIGSSPSSTRLNAAGFAEIEPDINEDPLDRWETNSISSEDFKYGEYDGHHTFFEGEKKGTFWGLLAEEIAAAEPPTGFQGLISWLYPPAIVAGIFFHVPGEYLYIATGLFTAIFCIIEMDKPDKPHHFEPEIYNMERGARDKLINDYNTMDIWDFNEKYGDLWDFTVKKDDIMTR